MGRCLIVCESCFYGNTEKITDAMAEVSKARICKTRQLEHLNLSDYGIIGLGSGIAYGRHYDILMEAAGRSDLRGKNVFVFSTSGTGNVQYNFALIDLLQKMGASVIGSFACRGCDRFGPFRSMGGISEGHPDKYDLEAARKFMIRTEKHYQDESLLSGKEKSAVRA